MLKQIYFLRTLAFKKNQSQRHETNISLLIHTNQSSGLDPANPFISSEDRISMNDADLVEIIHTSVLGLQDRLGHMDFYPNNETQPGCSTIDCICSHSRAWLYYSEVVQNSSALIGRLCSTAEKFWNGDCNNNPELSLTELSKKSDRKNIFGSYYLFTRASEPFGFGENGAIH